MGKAYIHKMMQWCPTFSNVGGDENYIGVSLDILSPFRQKHTALEHNAIKQQYLHFTIWVVQLVTRRVPYWWKRSYVMTISMWGEKYNFLHGDGACKVASIHKRWDWNEHWNEHRLDGGGADEGQIVGPDGSRGQMGVQGLGPEKSRCQIKVGIGPDGNSGKIDGWGSQMGAGEQEMWVGAGWGGASYLVPIPYLVPHHPLWQPIPLSGTSSPIRYPIPDRGTLPGRIGWRETTLMSHQSGILHSLIFFKFNCCDIFKIELRSDTTVHDLKFKILTASPFISFF